MELFQAKDHYILQSGERALWCSRRDGSLQLRAGEPPPRRRGWGRRALPCPLPVWGRAGRDPPGRGALAGGRRLTVAGESLAEGKGSGGAAL